MDLLSSHALIGQWISSSVQGLLFCAESVCCFMWWLQPSSPALSSGGKLIFRCTVTSSLEAVHSETQCHLATSDSQKTHLVLFWLAVRYQKNDLLASEKSTAIRTCRDCVRLREKEAGAKPRYGRRCHLAARTWCAPASCLRVVPVTTPYKIPKNT